MTKVVALIAYRNRFILIKKEAGRFNGKWTFPSAVARGRQTQKDAIIRRVKTALGLNIWPSETIDDFPSHPQPVTLFKCNIQSNPADVALGPDYSEYLWTNLANATAFNLAPLDYEIATFLAKKETPRKTEYDMSPGSLQARLLALLQDSPDRPVSFVALGTELGISRQYARLLYYELKIHYLLPPVKKRMPRPKRPKNKTTQRTNVKNSKIK